MTIPNCIVVLNQDPRSESSQLKIFIGAYSDLEENNSLYGGQPRAMHAFCKSLLQAAMKAESRVLQAPVKESTKCFWENAAQV